MALLRGNANFRYLWSGEIVSMFGDWFNLIASAALLGMLTQSGTAVGALFVVRMLAPFLVSPIAGVLADRYNRKHIMIMTDLCRAVVVLGFLLVRDADDIWLLYTLTALQLALSGLFVPARNAILPDIVSRSELGAANALSSATFAVMLALGAAMGGFAAGAWGIYETFVIDALSFLVSAFLCAKVKYRMRPAAAEADRSVAASLKQYMDGLRYLRDHVDILFIAMHKGANALFITGGLNVLMVILASTYFPAGEGSGISIGLFFCATGIGTAVGPLIARRFTGDRERSLRRGLVLCYVISAAGLAIAAPLLSFGIVLFGIFLRGVGGGMMWVFSTQLLMERLPSEVRGRVFATEFAMRTLMNAAGTAAASLVLDAWLGVSGTLWLMAGLALLPGILWVSWLVAGASARSVHDGPVAGAQEADD